MLVITGTGRSGTRLVAKWFQEMGLLPYQANWIDKFDAGLEPSDVTRVNGAIWIGNDEKYATKEAQQEAIKGFDYSVIKDPNFFYGDVLETWLEVRKDLKFLVLIRDFNAVYESRMSKGMVAQALGSPTELALAYGRFCFTIEENEIETQTLVFPNFLNSWSSFADAIHLLGIEWESEKKGWDTWKKIVDKSKVHF